MRQIAVRAADAGVVITSDLDVARAQLARADFFGQAFNLANDDLLELHRRSAELIRQEAMDWDDLRISE